MLLRLNERTFTLENDLFTWDGWDAMDANSFLFYDVKLNVDMGKFPKGTQFHSAFVDYQAGDLEFYSEEDEISGKVKKVAGKFKLKLTFQQI